MAVSLENATKGNICIPTDGQTGDSERDRPLPMTLLSMFKI